MKIVIIHSKDTFFAIFFGQGGERMKAKHWAFLLSGILLISFFLLLLPRFFSPEKPVAEIYRDGVLIQTVNLSHITEPLTIPLIHEEQENILEVFNGGIRMKSANCPDKLCVHQGEIRTGASPIVCLPQRLVIQIKDGYSATDAISQ